MGYFKTLERKQATVGTPEQKERMSVVSRQMLKRKRPRWCHGEDPIEIRMKRHSVMTAVGDGVGGIDDFDASQEPSQSVESDHRRSPSPSFSQ